MTENGQSKKILNKNISESRCLKFEDFYIVPENRRKGIAREIVRFAYENSGVESLTVACADCDLDMYGALGFTIRLGNLLALE